MMMCVCIPTDLLTTYAILPNEYQVFDMVNQNVLCQTLR